MKGDDGADGNGVERTVADADEHGDFVSLETEEDGGEDGRGKADGERGADKEDADLDFVEELGRELLKEARDKGGDRRGEDKAKRARDEEDAEAGAGAVAAAGKVVAGFVFRNVLGDGGLDAEVEVPDVGAELEDEDPSAIHPDGQAVSQVHGKQDGDDRGEAGADDVGGGVAEKSCGGGGSGGGGFRDECGRLGLRREHLG